MKTLKLSAVALALGAGHTAFALECNSNTENVFNSQKNAVVENCKIQTTISSSSDRTAISIHDSSNLSFSNLNLNMTGDFSRSESTGIEAHNSSFSISNSQLKVNGTDRPQPIHIYNSTLSVQNSTLSTEQADTGGSININNSTLTIKDSQLRVTSNRKESLAELITLNGNNRVILENVSGINSSDSGSAFAAYANGKNHFTINNSSISAFDGLRSWWNSSENQTLNTTMELNNSNFNTTIFMDSADPNDENSALETINVTANSSNISGAISADLVKNGSSHSIINVKLNDSHWETRPVTIDNITVTNYVSDLNVNNSSVILTKVDNFQTLGLGDLSGNGTFVLNTDLANEKSDQIVVNGKAEGSHTLDVKDSGNTPKSANGLVTLVKLANESNAKFSLAQRDYVDAGAYRYRLHKQGNDWVLSNNANEKSTPSLQPNPTVTTKPNTAVDTATVTTNPNTSVETATAQPAVQKMLSSNTNSLVSLRQAQLLLSELEVMGIHQRLGEQKTAESRGVWVRSNRVNQKVAGLSTAQDSQTSGFKQQISMLQLGADKQVTDYWRVGGFVGTSRSDVDFNGEYGKAKIRSVNAGLYATFQTENGFYVDNIAKYDRLQSSSTGQKTRYRGYTLSSEIGKAFDLPYQFTLTPKAQVAWTTISGARNIQKLSAYYAQAGVRVAKVFALGHQSLLQPYAEVNMVTSKNRHSQVQVDQDRFNVAQVGGRIETVLGLKTLFGQHGVGVELRHSKGKNLQQPFELQAVYRYQW